MDEKLTQAAARLKAGDRPGAQRVLTDVLKSDPRNDQAWLYMSAAVDDSKRRYCIEQALRINPDNRMAQKALAQLDQAPAAMPSPGATATTASAWQAAREETRSQEAAVPQPALRPSLQAAAPAGPKLSPEVADRAPQPPHLWVDPAKNVATVICLDHNTFISGVTVKLGLNKALAGLAQGRPAQDLLANSAVIPLAAIQEVRENSGVLRIKHVRERTLHTTRVSFRKRDQMAAVFKKLAEYLGTGFTHSSAPMGVVSRLITILMLLLVLCGCVGFFYWGALESTAGNLEPTGSARTRGLVNLIGLLGPTGVLIIGGFFLLLLVLYSISMFIKPPMIHILTRTAASVTEK